MQSKCRLLGRRLNLEGTKMNDLDTCPICGEKAEARCKCMRGDRRCKNGHNWHRCTVHKEVVLEASDHNMPTNKCTCVKIECSFSTGICETITCSHDGRFDQYGYPVVPCPKYSHCKKIKRMRLESDRRECQRRMEEIDAALDKLGEE